MVKSFPHGLEDVSKYPALIQELLRRNWTENELAGVLRHNFLRVFEQVERVSERIHLYNENRWWKIHEFKYFICWHTLFPSFIFTKVRDQLSSNLPSEVQIPFEEAHNPCRLVLRRPDPRSLPSDQSSGAEGGLPGLLILATVLVLSRIFLIEWILTISVQPYHSFEVL